MKVATLLMWVQFLAAHWIKGKNPSHAICVSVRRYTCTQNKGADWEKVASQKILSLCLTPFRKIGAVVLTIRGTFSLADAIADIVCDEDPFLDGFAHRGILNGAK